MVLIELQVLLMLMAAACSTAAPAPHQTVILFVPREQHKQTDSVVEQTATKRYIALQYDEGLEETEEGLEEYNDSQHYQTNENDQQEANGNDGRYVPEKIYYDVDESENNTRYEDYNEIPTSTTHNDCDYDYNNDHGLEPEVDDGRWVDDTATYVTTTGEAWTEEANEEGGMETANMGEKTLAHT